MAEADDDSSATPSSSSNVKHADESVSTPSNTKDVLIPQDSPLWANPMHDTANPKASPTSFTNDVVSNLKIRHWKTNTITLWNISQLWTNLTMRSNHGFKTRLDESIEDIVLCQNPVVASRGKLRVWWQDPIDNDGLHESKGEGVDMQITAYLESRVSQGWLKEVPLSDEKKREVYESLWGERKVPIAEVLDID